MAGYIEEFFGYAASDASEQALCAASSSRCPFLNGACTKMLAHGGEQVPSGVCAVSQKKTPTEIICCPNRLYANNYELLRIVGHKAFGVNELGYYAGSRAIERAKEQGGAIAVYGHGWGGELRLPKRTIGGERVGNYFMDWVLARLNARGELVEFTAIEVQTIDTTGNYRSSRAALLNGRYIESSTVGLNWENVNKRILPQVIYKGQVLQREPLCKTGLWFVTPRPVYERIEQRLGGASNIGFGFPSQPGAIHFLQYDYDRDAKARDGEIRPLVVVGEECTTVERVSAAFNHVVLPEPGVYEEALRTALFA